MGLSQVGKDGELSGTPLPHPETEVNHLWPHEWLSHSLSPRLLLCVLSTFTEGFNCRFSSRCKTNRPKQPHTSVVSWCSGSSAVLFLLHYQAHGKSVLPGPTRMAGSSFYSFPRELAHLFICSTKVYYLVFIVKSNTYAHVYPELRESTPVDSIERKVSGLLSENYMSGETINSTPPRENTNLLT